MTPCARAWLSLLPWMTAAELRSLLDEGAAMRVAARVPGLRCPSEERAADVVAEVLAEMDEGSPYLKRP